VKDDDDDDDDDGLTAINKDTVDAANDTPQLNGLLNECIILLRSVTTQ